MFPARDLFFLQQRKVRLRDCRQGPLLLPRQGSAHCLSHVHAIAETLSQTTTKMIFTITMSIRHPLAQPFLVVHAMHGSILWKIARCLWISARCLWKSARCLQHLLWDNSFRCVFFGCAKRSRRAPEPLCGTVTHFASTIVLSGEQEETR